MVNGHWLIGKFVNGHWSLYAVNLSMVIGPWLTSNARVAKRFR
jgi:hypothetical protein